MKFHFLWQFLYGCLEVVSHRQEVILKKFKKNILSIRTECFLNFEADLVNFEADLVPTVRNNLDSIWYRVYSLKIKFVNVHARGCALRDKHRDSFEILEQKFDYQRCTST